MLVFFVVLCKLSGVSVPRFIVFLLLLLEGKVGQGGGGSGEDGGRVCITHEHVLGKYYLYTILHTTAESLSTKLHYKSKHGQ